MRVFLWQRCRRHKFISKHLQRELKVSSLSSFFLLVGVAYECGPLLLLLPHATFSISQIWAYLIATGEQCSFSNRHGHILQRPQIFVQLFFLEVFFCSVFVVFSVPCLLVFCFILCCFFVAFPLSCKCVLCFIFTTSFCAAQQSSGRHATPAPTTPKSEKVAKNNKSSYNKRQQQQQQLLLWLLKCFNFLSLLFIRFEIRVYLYLCVLFFLFASHFRYSPLALAHPEDEVRRLPLLLWRKLQRIIFTLRQRIWSVSRRCLYVCMCVCLCVCIYPTIASCCRCLAPLASGIRNIAIWKSILLMIAM